MKKSSKKNKPSAQLYSAHINDETRKQAAQKSKKKKKRFDSGQGQRTLVGVKSLHTIKSPPEKKKNNFLFICDVCRGGDVISSSSLDNLYTLDGEHVLHNSTILAFSFVWHCG